MLAVGARLAPDDGAGLIVDSLAVSVHRFAVALHVALLEVGRKSMQVLVIGQDGLGLGAEKIIVPDADEGQDDRDVFLKGAF